MNSYAHKLHGSDPSLRDLFAGPARAARVQRDWWQALTEFAGVVAGYVLLAWIGQIAAIEPGNITPIYPAAGFAIACVLLRGPRVWPGIWLGQLLGNAWAIIDLSGAGVAAATSFAAVATSCGAVFQALAGAYLIKRCCGAGSLFQELRQLYSFVGIVIVTCVISAFMGVTGLLLSGILAWETYGFAFFTWYLGDLVGAVLFVPLIITWPSLVDHIRDSHRSLETGAVLWLVVAFTLGIVGGYIPRQLAGSALLLLTLPVALWAALRLAQPGVAIMVNLIGVLAGYLTTQGSGPFAIEDSHVALELLQMFMMVTMVAGLSLAIVIAQLRRSESSFRTLRLAIDQAGDAVFLVRPDASLEYVNAQAAKLLGYRREALMLMAVPDFDQNFPAATWSDFWRDKVRRNVLHFESVVRRQDGFEVPVEVSVNHLAVDGKELACAIVKDISARKRAEESRNRMEQILNSSTAVIYEKDLEGRYEFVNNRWGQLFDIQPCEVRGKTDFDLFPREMAEAFCRNDRQVMESRQSLQIEEVAPHSDGPHTYVSIKVPVWGAGGRVRGVAGISTDISEQLAAKEELKNSERLAAIGKMITGLAHECRNALQRSQACLSMLLREIRENPKATDYANRLQQAQDHLQHVFEELRSYAAPLHLEKRRCNLRALIDETWEQVASISSHPDVVLRIMETDLDLTCDVDAFRIQQVFRNVFENAVCVSSPLSAITVEWSRADLAAGPALRTTIRDEGPGFTPQQLAQAFKPFYTTKVTGTGLGLTIARRIVEGHGGRIEIKGDSQTGGIVVITLPQRREI